MTRDDQQMAMTTRPRQGTFHAAGVLWWGCGLALLTGCQTLAGPTEPVPADIGTVAHASGPADGEGERPVALVSGESSLVDQSKKTGKRLRNFFTGREQENLPRAKELYQQGDALFRQAIKQSRDEARATYVQSAKLFRRAGEAAPGTALEQDAMFMQGESLFFADRLTEAADVYEKLQKEYPRNRHLDRVAARLFSISRYWIETVKADEGKFKLNLTDRKRPRLDVDGHAIRVLDQIRYDDPTGRLADDATMAAAAEYIRQKKFEQADEFLTDLRETFTDSEHLFLAHMLGIRCKLETYAGSAYSGLVLEEAETLVRQTRQRFPDRLAEAKYGDMVARAASEIAYLQAERLAYRAEYREKQKNYGAARVYYQQILEQHPDTPHADTARTRLAKIENLPAVPSQRLSWLTTVFPDNEHSTPLEFSAPPTAEPEGKTLLR
jgi:outer membrane protein assembly factor BamD (BamD/ComL family)